MNLKKAGFKIDYGYDGTGFIMKTSFEEDIMLILGVPNCLGVEKLKLNRARKLLRLWKTESFLKIILATG
jgi:hypothetical protein